MSSESRRMGGGEEEHVFLSPALRHQSARLMTKSRTNGISLISGVTADTTAPVLPHQSRLPAPSAGEVRPFRTVAVKKKKLAAA